MKNVILLVLAGFAGWYGYSRYQQRSHASIAAPAPPAGARATPTAAASPADPFKCDGRIYCSLMTSCAEAARLKPDFLQAWNNLGLALERAARPAEAIDALRHALALDAGYPPALRNVAALALRSGEFALALELARRVLAHVPADTDMRRCEGRALLGLARFDAAKAVLDALNPGDWPVRSCTSAQR